MPRKRRTRRTFIGRLTNKQAEQRRIRKERKAARQILEQLQATGKAIYVDDTPPRQKHKLNQNTTTTAKNGEKILTSVDLDVIVLVNTANHEDKTCDLKMECWQEKLSTAQLNYRNELKADVKEFHKKLQLLINSPKAKVIFEGELTSLIQVSNSIDEAAPAVQTSSNISGPAAFINDSSDNFTVLKSRNVRTYTSKFDNLFIDL